MADQLAWDPINITLPRLLNDAFAHAAGPADDGSPGRSRRGTRQNLPQRLLSDLQGAGAYETMGTGLPASNNFDVGVVVSWPIFNGFQTEHQVAQAKYNQQAIKHQIEDLRQQIVLEVTRSFLDWQASVAAIGKAQAVLDASQEELHLAEHRYKAGLGNVVELEDAQTRFTLDQSNYVDALYTYAVMKASVQHATARSLSLFAMQ